MSNDISSVRDLTMGTPKFTGGGEGGLSEAKSFKLIINIKIVKDFIVILIV